MMSDTDDIAEICLQSSLTSKTWDPGDGVISEAIYFDHLPSYEQMFQKILLKNQLCIIGPFVTAAWPSRQLWVQKNGTPNFEYIGKHFGDATAPVADCSGEEFCSHPKSEMKVQEFLTYWQDYAEKGYPANEKCLYLKDWHFTRDFPDSKVYTPPAFLCSDWINEFWDSAVEETAEDDYKFVYMGPRNSWTPFHADVLHSYSWSANICGRKMWIFYPPGAEAGLRDRHGQLVFDLRSSELKDDLTFSNASRSSGAAITVIQEPGEIIFVPSGWHHQVFNLEDTISINHNWTNGCGAHLSWAFLKSRLTAVQKEIEDCRAMDDWDLHCQLILKSDSGMDYKDFFNFLSVIAEHRILALRQECVTDVCDRNGSRSWNQRPGKESGRCCLCLLTSEQFCGAVSGSESTHEDVCDGGNAHASRRTYSPCKDEAHIDVAPSELSSPAQRHAEELAEKKRISDILTVGGNNHLNCPHWAHSGPNLAVFDLRRIKVIVHNMLEQSEFKAVLPQLTSEPRELILNIDKVLDCHR
ncbi:2-oxoglutarate and iron-dependent oxygenase JMJD4 isoform X2 [Aplysia californica]|nr:2-oxoglutarate and iron-dependent oxygenase JMJD4 isoform X2 [Aplysia californica]XP_035828178.1 2-oxoglutarate and iron-dependent oxygenase JMJD4 isoform X2 [Aplysia californica]XP_035828179.1 2-oxoglutarate and iron-dependent oxygenase JMJD4 isoform X2 [Aplysia californica]